MPDKYQHTVGLCGKRGGGEEFEVHMNHVWVMISCITCLSRFPYKGQEFNATSGEYSEEHELFYDINIPLGSVNQ